MEITMQATSKVQMYVGMKPGVQVQYEVLYYPEKLNAENRAKLKEEKGYINLFRQGEVELLGTATIDMDSIEYAVTNGVPLGITMNVGVAQMGGEN